MVEIVFPPPPPSTAVLEDLRQEVREFLAAELAQLPPRERVRSWMGFDAEFSRKLGQRGWIGMTWPKRYGGHERSAMERYVVLEELLAGGAPVSAHWIADRQSGPLLLKYGAEEQRREILPRIAAGECFFCIGMSEPDSGSDLASVRTRARPVEGGFVVNGTKVWTTNAHHCHYMVLFCRTGESSERHAGFSQFLVDLKTPGIGIRPIADLSGEHHFNEVVFQDVFLPASALLGKPGEGWHQLMEELAFERSGPERFLSSFVAMVEALRVLEGNDSEAVHLAFGRMTAQLVVLRRLSRSVAGMLQRQEKPDLQASLVKDLGGVFEQEVPDILRALVTVAPSLEADDELSATLARLVLLAPSFSLRGGTREILRGIIARGLGLR